MDKFIILDELRISTITGGDKDFAKELLDIFSKETQKKIVSLENEEKFSIIMRTAHSIKGSASNMGANKLSEAARVLELSAIAKNREKVLANAEKLKDLFQEFLQKLKTVNLYDLGSEV